MDLSFRYGVQAVKPESKLGTVTFMHSEGLGGVSSLTLPVFTIEFLPTNWWGLSGSSEIKLGCNKIDSDILSYLDVFYANNKGLTAFIYHNGTSLCFSCYFIGLTYTPWDVNPWDAVSKLIDIRIVLNVTSNVVVDSKINEQVKDINKMSIYEIMEYVYKKL